MTFRDLVHHAAGNLWRMKLRALLTVSGVVIAIAAFVSMISFGAGMQENIAREFDALGLLSTMQIYTQRESEGADSIRAELDDAAVEWLAGLPGVLLAYPFDEFSVTMRMGDSVKEMSAQAFPVSALHTKMFSRLEAGEPFESDSSNGVLVTSDFLKNLGIGSADSVLGKELIVSVQVTSLDSGLARIAGDRGAYIEARLDSIRADSLRSASYRQRLLRRELGMAADRFIDGFLNARATVSDTLTISGVLKTGDGGPRVGPVILPVATGRVFSNAGFSGNPTELLAGVSRGVLFGPEEGTGGKTYRRVTLVLESEIMHTVVADSVKAHGLRPFSYVAEFEQMLQFFFYFKMGLGLIGLIALVTASLGIVNTMVMSILERRREIGLLRSLGADGTEIRRLFLVESGVIGAAGAAGGILVGWSISRVASAIAKAVMESKGIDPMELFALPLWLVLLAFAIGLIVSLVAGYYPSSRAANLDPVEALRND